MVGSLFEGRAEPLDGGRVRPTIRGTAFVNSEATLIVNDRDPFRWGIR
ncbi:MAG TPA: proline racemase family protein [Thermoanaerobaculia bacterium]